MDSMNWEDLRAFQAVAEELSFTRAAARLRVAQSGLSVRIRRLERHLGVQLLERTTRRAALTPAGLALVDWIGRMEGEWQAIRSRVADLAAGPDARG